jgi:hypothetical protein
LRNDSESLGCRLNALTENVGRLRDCAPALSRSISCLSDTFRCSSPAAAIEHAERKHSKRHIDQLSLQIISRTESRFHGIAEFFFSGFRDVVE